PDEIAILFHHRLTKIHPFPNGNGRHAREMTNLLLENLLGQPLFTWGSANLVQAGECRDRYIRALQAADGYDFDPLFKFVRT
ncbi:MAG: Fic family protein, partial [bacterium]|nr:Fic family protein [bacterium]